MQKTPHPDHARPGPYDLAPLDEADLWFLPGPNEPADSEPVVASGFGGGFGGGLADHAEWQQAEAALAATLARLCARFGALDDRLRRGPEGWRHRLALMEAVGMSWLSGDRIAAEQLALWLALRLAGVQHDAQGLARAGWAFRRLSGGPGPELGPELAAFLGRQVLQGGETSRGASWPPASGTFAARIADWSAAMAQAAGLHPVSRAAFGLHLWALAGLSAEVGGEIEAAVVAARMAASEATGGALFLPLTLGGGALRRGEGRVQDRLQHWYDGAAQSVLVAMRHLDRLEAWTQRATLAAASRSGRTPLRLIDVLADWPLVSARVAEAQTGASRAAVQRNLIWLQQAGLLREVTGQGRYRFWTAQV